MKKMISLILLLSIWIGCGSFAGAEESLQEKIDHTPEGGVIALPNQTYIGNIEIKKPLTLRGSGNTVIRGDGMGNVITIHASHVTLENLQVEHGSLSRNNLKEYSAIQIQHGNLNVLRNLKIKDSFHGVYLDYANDNRIEEVEINGLGGGEIAGQGNGIQLNHSHHNQIVGNTIRDSRDGIYFFKSEENETRDNLIENTRYGLHYMYSDKNRFIHNRFTRNSGGAAIMVSRHIELQDNEFSFHVGPQAFGILMLESEDVQLNNNHFFHNVRGLYVDNSFNSRITNNEFSNNQVGVELLGSASRLTFTENRFFNNTAPVIASGGRSSNTWSADGKGNYWGQSFPLLDLNQDGVGDDSVIYKSSLNKLLKEKELAYLFLKSPAIALYEKLGELLNEQEIMFEDTHPLLHPHTGPSWTWVITSIFTCVAAYWLMRRRRAV